MKISCAFVFRKLREQQIDHTEDFLSSIVIISQFGSKSAVIMTCGQMECREKTMHLAILILRMCCCYFEWWCNWKAKPWILLMHEVKLYSKLLNPIVVAFLENLTSSKAFMSLKTDWIVVQGNAQFNRLRRDKFLVLITEFTLIFPRFFIIQSVTRNVNRRTSPNESTVKARFTRALLILTPHYQVQFALLLGKESR